MCKWLRDLFRPTRIPSKGLAMASPQYPLDLDLLDVKWWYVWGWGSYTDERHVP